MEGSSSISAASNIIRDQADDRDVFQCNICMEHPKNSVLTSCGHLFCWSCLYGWVQNQEKPCPLCKLTLGTGSIIPVYGCQKGSSRLDGSIPPRPSAPLSARQPDGSPHTANVGNTTSRRVHRESLDGDRYLQYVRSKAQADFQTVRRLHPPSWIRWIFEASESFDPSLSSGDGALGPTDDLQVFISDVLVPQGEHYPELFDFRMSWLQYYEARNWPRRSVLEHFDDFLKSWGMHFHAAWNRAGRPGVQTSVAEVTEESLLPRPNSSEDSVSESHASVIEREAEVELIYGTGFDTGFDRRRLERTGLRRIASEQSWSGRETRRANRRRRPYEGRSNGNI